jgi:hypothetical protein
MDVEPGPGRRSGAPTVASLCADLIGGEPTDELLTWPADVFALAGTVLRRTHAYRFAVSAPLGRSWPPRAGWNGLVEAAAEQWCLWLDDRAGEPPSLVTEAWAALRTHATAPLAAVTDGTEWSLVEALLTLSAVSDETCAGVAGTVAPVRTAGPRHRGRAAELLAHTGSLSRLPTWKARVLPKVRTPPNGISFRSLSRYVCLRGPSVDVAWHRAPARRAGRQQKANVLLLPWPLRIRQRDFRPVPGSVQRSENEPYGVFEFSPAEPFDLGLVEDVLRGALDEVDTLDAVLLPESAVPADQLQPLQALLARHGVSVLLAGVREPAAEGRRPVNWVHLGVHVGGCWAQYRQHKHHRWFLDESQISQYHLAGALHPAVRWWEDMEVPPRSLQFLELGGGLTIVAVVCEDLARLDEVAELLRDVGPSLVVTILLDGPQLASRWTARYASVLADDPGSSVLTLSAAGMVARSRPGGQPPSHVVALWKDAQRGLREISLDPGSHGVLMTIAATRARRRAADGRTPVDNVAGLVVAGLHAVTATSDGVPTTVERTVGAALGPTDLTIVTSWADALVTALHDAGSAASVIADLPPDAPWRADLGLPEPSPELVAALDALAAAVADAERNAEVLQALASAPLDGPAGLARTVLRAALESHADLHAGRLG